MGKYDLDELLSELGVSESATPARRSDSAPPSSDSAPTEDAPHLGDEAFKSIYTPEAGSEGRRGATEFANLLVQRGAVTAQQLTLAQTVLKQSPGHRLVDVLLDQEDVDRNAVQALVAEHAGLAYERLNRDDIDSAVDGRLLQRLTVPFAKQHGVLPLRIEGDRVVIGAVRPDDVFLLDDVRRALASTFPDLQSDVQLVWEPAWSPDLISDKGYESLGRARAGELT